MTRSVVPEARPVAALRRCEQSPRDRCLAGANVEELPKTFNPRKFAAMDWAVLAKRIEKMRAKEK